MEYVDVYEKLLTFSHLDRKIVFDEKTSWSGAAFLQLVGYFQDKFEKEGITQRDAVVVICSPSAAMIAALFALGMIGAAYVPIAPDVPLARQQLIIDDLDAKYIVTNLSTLLTGTMCHHIFVDDCISEQSAVQNGIVNTIRGREVGVLPVIRPRDPEMPAYLIYTSGTTGTPKGVMVTYKNLNSFLHALDTIAPVKQTDRYLLSTSLQFDVSVSEIFGWVLGGGSLFVLNARDTSDIRRLPEVVYQHEITHLATSPSVAGVWSASQINMLSRSKLRYFFIAGETFPPSLVKSLISLFETVHVYNCYGPTEVTVYATFHEVTPADENIPIVPIGRPIPGVSIRMERNEAFAHAELLLGGNQVARGYWKRPSLTENAFVEHEGQRFYKTGDLVSLDARAATDSVITDNVHGDSADNDLFFRGRCDHQLEINSIRIEPGEIEGAVVVSGLAKQCCVMMVNKVLTCFYVIGDIPFNFTRWRARLSKVLPDYAIPIRWVNLHVLPLNINGKVDRKQLIASIEDKSMSDVEHHQSELAQLLSQALSLPHLSDFDDIFDFGVDSLGIIHAEILLEEHFNCTIDAGFLYAHPTVASIRACLEAKRDEESREVQKWGAPHESVSSYVVHDEPSTEAVPYFVTVPNSDTMILGAAMSDSFYKTLPQIASKRQGLIEILLADEDISSSYPSSIYQRVYCTVNFDSFTVVDRTIEESHVYEKSAKIVWGLVECVEAFRTRIYRKHNSFSSKVFRVKNVVLSSCDIASLSHEEQETFINDTVLAVQRDILANLCGGSLGALLLFRISSHQTRLLVVLHHTVSDAASSFIVQKNIATLLQEKPLDPAPRMRDYVECIAKHSSTDEIASHPFTTRLKNLPSEARHFVEVDLFFQDIHTLLKPQNASADQILVVCAEAVTRAYLQKIGVDVVLFQLLFNFRTVGEHDFSLLVNDCHETLTFYRERTTSDLDFMNALYHHLLTFHYHEGHSTGHAIYSNFPDFSSRQAKLRDIYETAVLNINYVGEVNSIDLDDMISKIRKLRDHLRGQQLKKTTSIYSIFLRRASLSNAGELRMIGLACHKGRFISVQEKLGSKQAGLKRFYTRFIGICGSDMQRLVYGSSVNYLGHEAAGIDSCGNAVVLNPLVPCKKCIACQSGRTNLCENGFSYGTSVDGACRGWLNVPKDNLIHAASVAPEYVLCDSIAVVIHGICIAKQLMCNLRDILVLGDGSIARLLVLLLNCEGIVPHIVTRSGKWRYSQRLMATCVGSYDSLARSSYDIVFECVGFRQRKTLDTALSMVCAGGAIIVFGVFPVEYRASFVARSLFEHEVKFCGVRSFLVPDFLEATSFVDANRSMISNALPFHIVNARDISSLEESLKNSASTKIVIDFADNFRNCLDVNLKSP